MTKVIRKKRKRKLLSKVIILLVAMALIYAWIVNSIYVKTDPQIIEVGEQCSYNVTAKFLERDITKLGRERGEVDFDQIGEYQVEYTPYWIPKKYTKTIKIVDETPPEIKLKGEEVISVNNIEEFVEPGFTAIDNYDGDITSQVRTELVQVENKFYEVHYSVTDSSGNVKTVTRVISIEVGTIYLTFDDGPSLDITPEILKILHANNIPATFFVVRYGENKEHLIRKELIAGHNVGLHGYSHDYAEIYTDLDTLMENFYQIETLVSNTLEGYQSKIIRFPGGSSNTVSKKYCEGIMTEAVKRATEEGYVYFDWNVDSRDAGGVNTSEEVYQNVISGIREGRNNIVLMHDSAGNTKTVKALQRIIDYCIENGYVFKTITKETSPVHHKVSN